MSSSSGPVVLVALVLVVGVLAQGCAFPAPASTVVPAVATNSEPTAVPTTAAAEASQRGASLEGHWEGAVDAAGQTIVTRVDFTTDGGALAGTVDFPQQLALGLPLAKIEHEAGKVHFEALPQPRTAIFDGELEDNGKITGTFRQAGFEGTFHLERVQTQPAEKVPYHEEEVTFKNADVTLAGTLTLPESASPYPAVVLISGSGPQNRDEELFGFKIFRVIADHLTRRGIAVLRYDDRGVGGSSAGTSQDTTETFAGDVLAGVNYLKGRSEIDPKRIGLLGHSEGGIIAPLVATQSPDVAFVILMSGPGLTGRQIIMEQQKLILKADGSSDAVIAQKSALQNRVIEAALTGKGWDEVKAELRKEFKAAAESAPASQREAMGDVDKWVETMVKSQTGAMQGAWMKFFLTYDPAPTLEQVRVPVLALFGGKDLQVPAEVNRDAILKALERGGNHDFASRLFPEANHLYQNAQTGSPSEYATLKPEFTPGFLDAISEWVLAHPGSSGK